MHFREHALAGTATSIPIGAPSQVLSVSPITLPCSDRTVPLELRVTVPSTGDKPLPIVLLSHGHGPSNHLSSLEGYAPLAEFLAARGFAVLQPTHLNSRSLGIPVNDSNIRDLFLNSRALDMTRILDRIDEIEAVIPSLLKGRLDSSKVAVVGHSLGGLTASILLGAVNTDPRDGESTNLVDKRITAGVIIGGTGSGGDALSQPGRQLLPFYDVSFKDMHTPALVVWGDLDESEHLTSRGARWHLDPYTFSPGPKASLMVQGAKHGFGGISGWDTAETADESPERLTAVLRLITAYLESQLSEDNNRWNMACKALERLDHIGKVEVK